MFTEPSRKKSGSNSDPFWEQSAEIVFNACAQYQRKNNLSIEQLTTLVRNGTLESLSSKLANTEAARYLDTDNKSTSGSVLSVLATNTKPLSYLQDKNDKANSFSLKEYFRNIDNGAASWLFLATKPSSRELTQSLIACLTELALAQLLDIGIKQSRRIWFIFDELAALGRLPALSMLMSEGRKYGACIVAGQQSLNQLYSSYGQYDGSTIFGQFGTAFFFRNTESVIAKAVSSMSGNETITRQQKNTSFGANEFRDGISYSEHEQKKLLIEPSDLASLATGQCYVFLSEPQVRIAKIQVLEIFLPSKNSSFITKAQNKEQQSEDRKHSKTTADEQLLSNEPPQTDPAPPKNVHKPKSKNKDKKLEDQSQSKSIYTKTM